MFGVPSIVKRDIKGEIFSPLPGRRGEDPPIFWFILKQKPAMIPSTALILVRDLQLMLPF